MLGVYIATITDGYDKDYATIRVVSRDLTEALEKATSLLKKRKLEWDYTIEKIALEIRVDA